MDNETLFACTHTGANIDVRLSNFSQSAGVRCALVPLTPDAPNHSAECTEPIKALYATVTSSSDAPVPVCALRALTANVFSPDIAPDIAPMVSDAGEPLGIDL